MLYVQIILSSAACFAFAAAPAFAAQATLKVEVDKPGVKISPTLYGIFFEEINCAGDGGLYAELVRNRSFEESDKPDSWTAVGGAKLSVDTEKPLTDTNKKALRIKLTGNDFSGVANDGYWGISVVEGAAYNLALWARCAEGFAGPIEVRLESQDGKAYASAIIDRIKDDWAQFKAVLKSEATDARARLVVGSTKAGVVWLDVVSLFPEDTFKGRPNGLRPDLAQMLADLKPSFMRFPGGCWVEGDTLEFAQRWKRTIGDIGDRRTQYNLWQYYSTNGLGYHEYLQLCEDLGAEPLFVINCGMSHKENAPMDKLDEWVQDALDAIEYANGSAESPWGAVRAKNGHPAPFNMKFMEIGNENGGPAYEERYTVFYDAIKAKYPDMKLIANVLPERRPADVVADIVDEHYYAGPDFFIANANKYDSYKRDGHKIFVGEYAVNRNCGAGNLRGALGEAAFMTGMERNSDVVVMACYAPLFCNVNYKKWNPDLIDFDSSRVYGLPSYYVQKMFSENRGDVVMPLELSTTASIRKETACGAAGVGTWATEAEFKDIRITQGDKVLYASDFEKPKRGWRYRGGKWDIDNGALVQKSDGGDCRATVGDAGWTDYTLSLKARKLGGLNGFMILFQVRDDDYFLWWNLGGWDNQKHAIERALGGSRSILGNEVPGRIENNRWYDIRIETTGERIRCYLDGKLLHDVAVPELKPLHAVVSRTASTGNAADVILKVVNVSNESLDTHIELNGAKEVAPEATATLLTSDNVDDENTLDEPEKVAPKTTTINNAAPSFRHTFPAKSLTVMRVKIRSW